MGGVRNRIVADIGRFKQQIVLVELKEGSILRTEPATARSRTSIVSERSLLLRQRYHD